MFQHHSIIHMQFKIALTLGVFLRHSTQKYIRDPQDSFENKSVHIYISLSLYMVQCTKKRSYLEKIKQIFHSTGYTPWV